MKLIIVLCAVLLGSVFCILPSETKPVSFQMDNHEWFFPSSVGEAVTRHQMDYKPPGYFYKEYPDGHEVILYYHYADGDFDNESQPREALFSRKLHSYTFRFANKTGVLDSLCKKLAATYNRKLVLTEFKKEENVLKTSFTFQETKFEWGLIPVNDELTIGIANGEKKIVVRYMYNLPPLLAEVYMKQFTE